MGVKNPVALTVPVIAAISLGVPSTVIVPVMVSCDPACTTVTLAGMSAVKSSSGAENCSVPVYVPATCGICGTDGDGAVGVSPPQADTTRARASTTTVQRIQEPFSPLTRVGGAQTQGLTVKEAAVACQAERSAGVGGADRGTRTLNARTNP